MRAVAIGIVVFVAALGLAFLMQPTSYQFVRERKVTGDPACFVAAAADVRVMASFAEQKEQVERSYSPVTTGVGAWAITKYKDEWEKRTEITAVSAEAVEMRTTDTTGRAPVITQVLVRDGVVKWAVGGELSGLRRALWPFVALEKRIGPDIDKFLERLAAHCNAASSRPVEGR